jgi:hypothetical protein
LQAAWLGHLGWVSGLLAVELPAPKLARVARGAYFCFSILSSKLLMRKLIVLLALSLSTSAAWAQAEKAQVVTKLPGEESLSTRERAERDFLMPVRRKKAAELSKPTASAEQLATAAPENDAVAHYNEAAADPRAEEVAAAAHEVSASHSRAARRARLRAIERAEERAAEARAERRAEARRAAKHSSKSSKSTKASRAKEAREAKHSSKSKHHSSEKASSHHSSKKASSHKSHKETTKKAKHHTAEKKVKTKSKSKSASTKHKHRR